MKSSMRSDMKQLLEREGFSYISTNKHETWSDGTVEVLVSCTPSWHRTLPALRANIRRARREHERHQ